MNKAYLKEFNIKLGQVKQEKEQIEKEVANKEREKERLPIIHSLECKK